VLPQVTKSLAIPLAQVKQHLQKEAFICPALLFYLQFKINENQRVPK
jgi:hypothetical protein